MTLTAKSATIASVPFLAVILTLLFARTACAQDRPSPVVEVQAGTVGFADDGIVFESLFGGAARWYALPRIGVGPEIVYINAANHSHLVMTGNLTWDLFAPNSSRPRAITPFIVAGIGLYQTRETFLSGPFTSNEGAFTVGGGMRAAAGERVTVGVDARLGWEPHIRINGLLGFRIGR